MRWMSLAVYEQGMGRESQDWCRGAHRGLTFDEEVCTYVNECKVVDDASLY